MFSSDWRLGQIRLSDKFERFRFFRTFLKKSRKGANRWYLKTSWPDFAPSRFLSKMFKKTEILKILQRALFDLFYNLRKKNLGSEKNTFLIFRPLLWYNWEKKIIWKIWPMKSSNGRGSRGYFRCRFYASSKLLMASAACIFRKTRTTNRVGANATIFLQRKFWWRRLGPFKCFIFSPNRTLVRSMVSC